MKNFLFGFLFGRKPDKQKETETSKKKMEVIYKFSIGTLNPQRNAKLALKITFSKGVTDPKVEPLDNHSVSIYDVEDYKLVKEESTTGVEYYYEVEEGRFYDKHELYIGTKNLETLYLGLPEVVK